MEKKSFEEISERVILWALARLDEIRKEIEFIKSSNNSNAESRVIKNIMVAKYYRSVRLHRELLSLFEPADENALKRDDLYEEELIEWSDRIVNVDAGAKGVKVFVSHATDLQDIQA